MSSRVRRLLRAITLISAVSLHAVAASRAGQSIESLLLEGGIDWIALSPSGEWVIAVARKHDVHGLLAQRLGSGEVAPLFATDHPILGLSWVGEQTFILKVWVDGESTLFAARIRQRDAQAAIEIERVTASGWLVDSLPLVDGELIWAHERDDRSSVYRARLDDLVGDEGRRSGRERASLGKALASVEGSVDHWIVDRHGAPRAALVEGEDSYALLVRDAEARDFREVHRFDPLQEQDYIYPLSISEDERALIVKAYNGNDTLGLFEFDLQQQKIGRELFRREDVDVSDVVFDYKNGELIAAVYEQQGERRYHYFEAYADRHLGAVRSSFPEEKVAVASSSADRSILILWVSSPTNPGTYYLQDAKSGVSTAIGEIAQGLDRTKLVDVETIEVESADGTRIEAFLALPKHREQAGAPLIVMPHGGPIGVRDNKDYDPHVQYFASWGFAVLQVNYRGSSGYGRRFMESGKKQWAQGIEDDIDAAVENAMARPEIDNSRICIVGGSYGGFSALASVIRHRSRYRCAASLNGATDITLSFSTGECADSESCVKRFADVVGDLETDREKFLQVSPAYHVDEIETPVLVIYGTEDRRVDPDHSHRLLLMLETYGKQHESLELVGAEHSPTRREWEIADVALRRFLTKHLFPGREFEAEPASTAADSLEYRALPSVTR